MTGTKNTTHRVGFTFSLMLILTVILLVVKFTVAPTLPWLAVLAPVLISVALSILALVVVGVVLVFAFVCVLLAEIFNK